MSSKTKAEDEQSSESPFLIMLLPKDVIVDIIARVRRCDYPTLSLVSKHFRSLVASSELYVRRSLLGCTEHCLYVCLSYYKTCDPGWYVLRRKPNGNRCLVPVPWLPASGTFIALGSKIYVFGESDNHCYMRSHTVQTLPSMPIPLAGVAAGIINGKIYIIGYCDNEWKNVVMVVFNTETQMWEPEIIKPDVELGNWYIGCTVVMADKMYTRDSRNSFVYDPKKNKWETEDMLNSKIWGRACVCVVDDVLYDYDSDEKCLRRYDPKKRCWGVVNGLEDLLAKTSWWSETVSYGGKLALFFNKQEGRTVEIWCAEISLERRERGEIWGKVEWCDQFMSLGGFRLLKSLAVVML